MKNLNILFYDVGLRRFHLFLFKSVLIGALLFCSFGVKAQEKTMSTFDNTILVVTKLPMNPVKGQVVLYVAPEPDEFRYFDVSNWRAILTKDPIKINLDLCNLKLSNQPTLGVSLFF